MRPASIDNYISDEDGNANKSEDLKVEYKSYGRRWLVLLAVLFLGIGNYAHWISFAAVLSKVRLFLTI